MSRQELKTAREHYKNEEYALAADFFERAGENEKAMECYARAKMYLKAADRALSLGRSDAAVTYYMRGGHVLELAAFYEARKKWEEAGKYYTRAGKHETAAEQYDNIVKMFPERREVLGISEERSESEIKACRYAASAHAKAGNYSRAAILYERIGAHMEMAANLLQANDYRGAGEAYKRAGMFDDAGRAFYKGNLFIDAAQCYKIDNNLVKAADACIQAKDYLAGADLYAQAGRYFQASIAYTDGNEIDKAIKVLTMIQPLAPRYLDAIESIVELSYAKRYLTPAAKRFCDDFISKYADPAQSNHFDLLYKVADMMEKSEYIDEANEILNKLRTANRERFEELQEQTQTPFDTSDSKIDINEILKQDFAAEFRRREFEERQALLQQSSRVSDTNTEKTLEFKSTQPVDNLIVRKKTNVNDIQIGKKFNHRYMILEHIGSGGMGSVYLAHDLELDEDIAIKMLSPQFNFSETAIARFKQEIKLARQINHPNVIRIFDFGDCSGLKYITMEYFRGLQLKDSILEQGFFTLDAGLNIAIAICDGLAAAHKLGIIHRDIKSHNIMLSSEGEVKILDFGIAKSLEVQGMTTDSTILGTPEYMSPEAIQQKPVDARSDIYSLGIVFYELFTGRVPFTGDSFLSVIHAHLEKDPPPPQSFNPDIPEDLVDVILTCIQRTPNNRYRSVAELCAELKMIRMDI